MGNSKFLIIVISVLSAVALICLGASASDLVRDDIDVPVFDSLDRSVGTSAPFNILDISYYYYSGASSAIQSTSVNPPVFQRIVFYNHGEVCGELSNGSFAVWRGFKTVGGIEYVVMYYNNASNYIILCPRTGASVTWEGYSSSASLTLGGASVSGSLIELNPVSDLGSTIFSLGNKLVSFVTSNAIVLIPLVCFVAIFGIACIRRLVKGV